jgi:hypothetical protein
MFTPVGWIRNWTHANLPRSITCQGSYTVGHENLEMKSWNFNISKPKPENPGKSVLIVENWNFTVTKFFPYFLFTSHTKNINCIYLFCEKIVNGEFLYLQCSTSVSTGYLALATLVMDFWKNGRGESLKSHVILNWISCTNPDEWHVHTGIGLLVIIPTVSCLGNLSTEFIFLDSPCG